MGVSPSFFAGALLVFELFFVGFRGFLDGGSLPLETAVGEEVDGEALSPTGLGEEVWGLRVCGLWRCPPLGL